MKKNAAQTPPIDTNDTTPQDASLESQIQMRAYELYLERGMSDGEALNDWLQAEQEIRERAPLTMAKAA